MMNNKKIPTAIDFFMNIFPAISGALVGSILSLGFFIFLKTAMSIDMETPLTFSKFLLFAIIFVSVVSSNILSVTFLLFANKGDFQGNIKSALMNIFFIIIILSIFSAPFLLILPIDHGFSLAKFILPFSAISSGLIFEIFKDSKMPILAAYKSIFSGLMIAGIFALFFPYIVPNEMMVFFALPIAWIIIPLVSLVIQIFWVNTKNVS